MISIRLPTAVIAFSLGLSLLTGTATAENYITNASPPSGAVLSTTTPTFSWTVDHPDVDVQGVFVTYAGTDPDLKRFSFFGDIGGTGLRASYVTPIDQQLFAGRWRWEVDGSYSLSAPAESELTEFSVAPGVRAPRVQLVRAGGKLIGTIRVRSNTRHLTIRAAVLVDGKPCRRWTGTKVNQRASLHLWSTIRIACVSPRAARGALYATVSGLTMSRSARVELR